MTTVMAMGEITIAQKAHTTHQSLRTTIPMSVVKQLKIREGDKLDWEFASENGHIYVKFKKSK
jgi:bifunctional DNA-binding transcriptional regulator/antitoxin component of YhaV-PrlF toxin-antitoxin module